MPLGDAQDGTQQGGGEEDASQPDPIRDLPQCRKRNEEQVEAPPEIRAEIADDREPCPRECGVEGSGRRVVRGVPEVVEAVEISDVGRQRQVGGEHDAEDSGGGCHGGADAHGSTTPGYAPSGATGPPITS